ncbi:MAG: alpha/beta fold hydrolase [Actinobacteria bacterium]|nr:alpha/beta fold hydrolase [Actinomycetota bacterium]
MDLRRSAGGTSSHIGGVDLDVTRAGDGPTLLFLHGGYPATRASADDPIVAHLASRFSVIAPTHPGFGVDPAPAWMTTVDDLAFLYLDLLDTLGESNVTVVGCSFGGWVAATVATMSTARIGALFLVGPLGIKVGDHQTRDIADIYSLTDADLADVVFVDPQTHAARIAEMDNDALLLAARSREATARYGWSPYLHDPKLKRRLARIDVATQVVVGELDELVVSGYAQAYADAIADASLVIISGCGHFPHIEEPKRLAELIAGEKPGEEQ